MFLSFSRPEKHEKEKRKLTSREKRFIKFASVEHDGQIYMTPQDFLESVVEGEPRPRFKRKRLTEKEVEAMMHRLPRLHKNSEHFFRSLGNQGIISYSEYLFLLTILIKPQSGFKIAFAMLDQDGNGWIDKTEFRVRKSYAWYDKNIPRMIVVVMSPGPGDGVQLRRQGEEGGRCAEQGRRRRGTNKGPRGKRRV